MGCASRVPPRQVTPPTPDLGSGRAYGAQACPIHTFLEEALPNAGREHLRSLWEFQRPVQGADAVSGPTPTWLSLAPSPLLSHHLPGV